MNITENFSKNKIKKAGFILINKNPSKNSYLDAINILSDFRLEHTPWLRNFRKLLISKTKTFKNILISQRLKRIPSIIKKLQINKTMSLARMQDLAWLRIVCDDLKTIYKIKKLIRVTEKQPNFKSIFKKEDDYIIKAKESWYRWIHLVYYYNSRCLIEIQIRSKIQHAWATAVEVMWSYLKQPLKQSFWDDEILEIFKKISKSFAILEKWEIDKEQFKDVLDKITNYKLLDKIKWFNVASNFINEKKWNKWKYFLIRLDFKNESLTIEQFNEWKLDTAIKRYSTYETTYKNNSNYEIVLVSVENIKKLKKLYPNYFLDTKEFLKYINKLKKHS